MSKTEEERAQEARNRSLMNIHPGSMVELNGLRNTAHLNGKTAEVLSLDFARRRYEIKLDCDGSIKKVRAENVALLELPGDGARGGSAGGGAAASGGAGGGADGTEDDGSIKPGTRVELQNLKSSANLNGERALILGRDPETDRYEIRMEMDGSTKQVKVTNFKLLAAARQPYA